MAVPGRGCWPLTVGHGRLSSGGSDSHSPLVLSDLDTECAAGGLHRFFTVSLNYQGSKSVLFSLVFEGINGYLPPGCAVYGLIAGALPAMIAVSLMCCDTGHNNLVHRTEIDDTARQGRQVPQISANPRSDSNQTPLLREPVTILLNSEESNKILEDSVF
ncbi:hypothetical protein RRG08_048122 [Elysia crispata]|uniref:Uncharacterized protein n=1 Tax=Elysia crispata TaxID=231223 RepID=A0AAE0ZJ65_9GAST|nr:hypothetical protein RRG08_048122 [Elysia crispata]